MREIKDFEKWNEQMIKKFRLEDYHNHPSFFIRFIEKKRVKAIIKLLEIDKNDKILDVGCGAGDIMKRINKGYLTGIDISEYILEIAQKRLKGIPKIRLVKGDAENLPQYFDEKFDKIYCSEVLEHVRHPEKVIQGITQISKKDSLIILSIPNEDLIDKIKRFLQSIRIFDILFPNISKKMDDEWHLHRFDLDLLKKISRNYLKIERIKRIPYWLLPIRYVVKFRKL